MVKRNVLLAFALALYAASFALPAIASSNAAGGAVRGYLCAWITLIVPWGHDGMNVLHDTPFVYFAILISGLITPVFLITTALQVPKPWQKLAAIFRRLLLGLIPSPWHCLYHPKIMPRVA